MAVLETIRVKFGILITVLIAIALLSFIIDPTSLSLFSSNQAQETTVASVNGHDVTYTEFSQKLSQYKDYYPYELFEAEMLKNNPEADVDDLRKTYNNEMCNMVMSEILNDNLYVVKAKEAGFAVGEEEMYQLLSGGIFSNTIFSQFRGQMNPDLLINFENQANAGTPEAASFKVMWDNIKKSTESERYITKYNSVFSKSMFSNPLLLEDEIQNSNNVFDVEFVMVPFGAAGDTTIVVTDKEIEDYYEAHKNIFRCTETRELHYIVVDVDEQSEDAEYEKLDSVLNNVNGVENFRKAAMDNGYNVDSAPVSMYTSHLGSVADAENVVKWSFKETEPGVVSEIYTISNNDNTYLVAAALGTITPAGFTPVEDLQVKMMIERVLYNEKAADKKLAEVKEKVNGLTDLNEVAKALGVQVSTKENLTFASSDFDPKFTGAASVAEVDVVNAPFKGSNGIYVYKVVNRSVESFFTENDSMNSDEQLNMMYGQMLQYVLTEEGNVENNSYLYF